MTQASPSEKAGAAVDGLPILKLVVVHDEYADHDAEAEDWSWKSMALIIKMKIMLLYKITIVTMQLPSHIWERHNMHLSLQMRDTG